MKHLVNIEQMDLNSLESAAVKSDVQVPEDLQERIERALAAAILADENEGVEAGSRPAGLEAGAAALEADARLADLETRPAGLKADALPTGQRPLFNNEQAGAGAQHGGVDARPEGLKADDSPTPLAGPRGGRKLSWLPIAGIAAAAAAIALLIMLPRLSEAPLRDTYDDPELAYAQVEETFKMISSKMAGGVALAAESGKQAGKPAQIIDKINRQ